MKQTILLLLLLLLPYSIQLQHFEGYDTFQGGEKTQRSTIRNAGRKNYRVDSRDWKEARVGAVAVSMGRLFQSMIVRGKYENFKLSVLQYAIG